MHQLLSETNANAPASAKLSLGDILLKRIRLALGDAVTDQILSLADTGTASTLAITQFQDLGDVCAIFGLDHLEFPPPGTLQPVDSSLYAWEAAEESMWSAVAEAMAVSVQELQQRVAATCAEGSALHELLHLSRVHQSRRYEAGCRTSVNLLLLCSISVLSGASAALRSSRTAEGSPNDQGSLAGRVYMRRNTSSIYRHLQLNCDMPVDYYNPANATTYSGRVDWGIGICPQISELCPRPQYMSCLTVVEAKNTVNWGSAQVQALGYMACIYNKRMQRGVRRDCTTYGVATDGHKWQFLAITQGGKVREGGEWSILQPGGVQKVMLRLIYILVRAAQLITPTSTPEKEPVNMEAFGAGFDDADVTWPAAVPHIIIPDPAENLALLSA
ncbi:hypothetical protein BDZ91DRAFT_734569 [Kalaharituber pfeilii]|nr:hypothetical protein BDZ91DRAFT_734569 [Kalaharituber pfeilii]